MSNIFRLKADASFVESLFTVVWTEGAQNGKEITCSFPLTAWNHLFMGLVVAILALEVKPMVQFVRWRIALHQKVKLENLSKLPGLQTINDIETIIMIFIPFIASAMARALVY